jgi:hypothetical protein
MILAVPLSIYGLAYILPSQTDAIFKFVGRQFNSVREVFEPNTQTEENKDSNFQNQYNGEGETMIDGNQENISSVVDVVTGYAVPRDLPNQYSGDYDVIFGEEMISSPIEDEVMIGRIQENISSVVDVIIRYITPRNLLIVFSALVILIALFNILKSILNIMIQFVFYLCDKQHINKIRFDSGKIDRSDIQKTLKLLKSRKAIRKFLLNILDSKMEIAGSWDNTRPRIKDDIADEILVTIDKRSLRI